MLYLTVEHADDYSWVLIRELRLSPGWNRETTDVLVPLGPDALTAPDNFYVPEGIRLASGATPANYSDGQPLLDRQWGQFSFHDQKNMWTPREPVEDGDNLTTFMIEVERRPGELS